MNSTTKMKLAAGLTAGAALLSINGTALAQTPAR